MRFFDMIRYMETRFEELKPEELKQIIDTVGLVYLPLGTLEWHERHLPLGLDAMVSEALCLAACEQTGGCVIPPLYFGTDREHEVNGKVLHGMDAKAGKELIGSIYYLNQELFFEVLKGIASNISKQGFRQLVVISAHSGSAQQETIEKLAQEKFGDLKIIVLAGRNFIGGIDHAGKLETQLLLAVDKSKVEISKITEPFEGLLGDSPLTATIEEGKKQFEAIVQQINNLIKKS